MMPSTPGYLECLAWDAATPWPWPGWGLAFVASVLASTRRHREFAVPCLVSGWCGLVAAVLIGFTTAFQYLANESGTCGPDVDLLLKACSAPFIPMGIITPIVLARSSIGLLRTVIPLLACSVGALLPYAVMRMLTTPYDTLRSLVP